MYYIFLQHKAAILRKHSITQMERDWVSAIMKIEFVPSVRALGAFVPAVRLRSLLSAWICANSVDVNDSVKNCNRSDSANYTWIILWYFGVFQVRSGMGAYAGAARRRVHLATVLSRHPSDHRPGRRQARHARILQIELHLAQPWSVLTPPRHGSVRSWRNA